MHSDPISDMLTRIRNAYKAGHKTVAIPYSIMKHKIAELMKRERYLGNVEVEDVDHAKKVLKVTLRYDQKTPAMSHVKRLSKPGMRLYTATDQLRNPLNGYGIGLISTSKGIMTYGEAKTQGIGGELICEIW